MRKIQILLSTMQKNEEEINRIQRQSKIKENYLIVNQIQKENINMQNVIISHEKGLSKSRNLALKEARGDICILADDDVIYEENYDKIIQEAYIEYSKADIICFYVESKNPKRTTRKLKTGRIGFWKTMRISSFQITFQRKSILENKIQFDGNFGAGTKWDRGEDAIFLCDCLKKKLKIQYVNEKIAEVEQKDSTWFKGFTKEYFYKQGAVFYRMTSKWYPLLNVQFCIRKYKKMQKKEGLFKTLKSMFKGVKDYKKEEEMINNE